MQDVPDSPGIAQRFRESADEPTPGVVAAGLCGLVAVADPASAAGPRWFEVDNSRRCGHEQSNQ